PSELAKLALVLYGAQYLARHPKRVRTFKGALSPILLVAGTAALLVAAEPDLGTALVILLTAVGLLVAAGMPLRYFGFLLLDSADGRRVVCQAARRRAHLAHPVPGDPQHLRGPRDRAAHRRAAPAHLLRADQPVRDPRRRRDPAQHRVGQHRPPAGGGRRR